MFGQALRQKQTECFGGLRGPQYGALTRTPLSYRQRRLRFGTAFQLLFPEGNVSQKQDNGKLHLSHPVPCLLLFNYLSATIFSINLFLLRP